VAAQQELGNAVRRLDLDDVLGERDGAIPMRRGGLEQEGLLENDLVTGILGQGFGIEIGGGNGIVVAARIAAIKSDLRAHLRRVAPSIIVISARRSRRPRNAVMRKIPGQGYAFL